MSFFPVPAAKDIIQMPIVANRIIKGVAFLDGLYQVPPVDECILPILNRGIRIRWLRRIMPPNPIFQRRIRL